MEGRSFICANQSSKKSSFAMDLGVRNRLIGPGQKVSTCEAPWGKGSSNAEWDRCTGKSRRGSGLSASTDSSSIS